MQAYVNGKFLPEKKALVSVFDKGFMYGFGVFETVLVWNGNGFRLKQHINRLFDSAKLIGLKTSKTKKEISEVFEKLVSKNKLEKAVIRIYLTAGIDGKKPSLVLTEKKLPKKPKTLYTKGVKVITVNIERFLPEAKSMNFLPSIVAKQFAVSKKASDALLIDSNGFVREGTTWNIFLVKEKKLITPRKKVLFGITRQAVIALARKFMKVEEREVKRKELFSADELFLTGSISRIVPVNFVDGRKIGRGKQGKVSLRLVQGLNDLIEKETS